MASSHSTSDYPSQCHHHHQICLPQESMAYISRLGPSHATQKQARHGRQEGSGVYITCVAAYATWSIVLLKSTMNIIMGKSARGCL